MMTQNADKKREQMQMFCMDDRVPQDHLLRLIDQAIDWSFIYELVIDKYSADNGFVTEEVDIIINTLQTFVGDSQ